MHLVMMEFHVNVPTNLSHLCIRRVGRNEDDERFKTIFYLSDSLKDIRKFKFGLCIKANNLLNRFLCQISLSLRSQKFNLNRGSQKCMFDFSFPFFSPYRKLSKIVVKNGNLLKKKTGEKVSAIFPS